MSHPEGVAPGRTSRWRTGDRLVFRHLTTAGHLSSLLPMTVVEDTGDRVVTWMAAGTPITYPALHDGSDIAAVPAARRFDRAHTTARRTWQQSALCVVPLAAAHSVRLSWTGEGVLERWYVNLEAPKQEWDLGLETIDHLLDLIVHPDGRSTWKDEDEATAAVQAGFLPVATLAAARAEGERILADRRAWTEALRPWARYRPPRGWTVPGPELLEEAEAASP